VDRKEEKGKAFKKEGLGYISILAIFQILLLWGPV